MIREQRRTRPTVVVAAVARHHHSSSSPMGTRHRRRHRRPRPRPILTLRCSAHHRRIRSPKRRGNTAVQMSRGRGDLPLGSEDSQPVSAASIFAIIPTGTPYRNSFHRIFPQHTYVLRAHFVHDLIVSPPTPLGFLATHPFLLCTYCTCIPV